MSNSKKKKMGSNEHLFCNDCQLKFTSNRAYECHVRKYCSGGHSCAGYTSRNNYLNDIKDYCYQPNATNVKNVEASDIVASPSKNFERPYERPGSGRRFKLASPSALFKSNVRSLESEAKIPESERLDIIEKLSKLPASGTVALPVESQLPILAHKFEKNQQEREIGRPSNSLRSCRRSNSFVAPTDASTNPADIRKGDVLQNLKKLLNDINSLRDQYVKGNGQDSRILEYLRVLEEEVLQLRSDEENDPKKATLEMQKQLQAYETANFLLNSEVEAMRLQLLHVAASDKRNELGHKACGGIEGYPVVRCAQQQCSPLTGIHKHEQRLIEMRQEAELYRQQLELERLKQELRSLRGNPFLAVLPAIPDPAANVYGRNGSDEAQDISFSQMPLACGVHDQIAESAFARAPYDPGSGFAVFWDFVCAPQMRYSCCQLVIIQCMNGIPVRESAQLPLVPMKFPARLQSDLMHVGTAMLGVKQMFPKCMPGQNVDLCVVVRASSLIGNAAYANENRGSVADVGWCKIDLFDSLNRLCCGRWKAPIRVLPVQCNMSVQDLNAVPQLGQSEIFYRLVNARDMDVQESVRLAPQQMVRYKFPPMEVASIIQPLEFAMRSSISPRLPCDYPSNGVNSRVRSKSPPLSKPVIHRASRNPSRVSRSFVDSEVVVKSCVDAPERTIAGPSSPSEGRVVTAENLVTLPSVQATTLVKSFGIQVDRIMDFSHNLIRVQLTVCDVNQLQSKTETTFSTSFVRPTFLKDVHVFALQNAKYETLAIDSRAAVLLVEIFEQVDGSSDQNELLVAWNAMKVFSSSPSRHNIASSGSNGTSLIASFAELVCGVANLQLFEPPVVKLKKFFDSDESNASPAKVITGATLTIHIFDEKTPPLTSSLPVPHAVDSCLPKGSWILGAHKPVNEAFVNGNAFDVYVDCGRFFPDACVASKVVISMFTGGAINKVSNALSFETEVNLDCNAFEPAFGGRFEFREFTYHPASKLLIKVYIIDCLTATLSLLGLTVLPLFVVLGTRESALASTSQFALNAGNFQLRLHKNLPSAGSFNEKMLGSPVLCSTLLVRIVPAACYKDGQPKSRSDFPEDEWIAEGIVVPPPTYSEGVYASVECEPTPTERQLMQQMVRRKTLTHREQVKAVINDAKKASSDQKLAEWLQTKFKVQESLPIFDSKLLVKYNSMTGIAFALDRAQNLSWTGLTFAIYYFTPPASYVYGRLDDPVGIICSLDPDSQQRHPQWRGDLQIHPRRRFHDNLAVVVQLFELVPDARVADGFVINGEAWTLIPACTSDYPCHGRYQIPLFEGSPSTQMMTDFQEFPLVQTISAMRKKKQLRLVEGMSVFVRIGDLRRIADLLSDQLETNCNYLPRSNKFAQVIQSRPLRSSLPPDVPPDESIARGANAFRKFVSERFERNGHQPV